MPARAPAARPDDQFLVCAEVAALMRVTPQTVSRYCRQGKIAGARMFAGQWRIHRGLFTASLRLTEDPAEVAS